MSQLIRLHLQRAQRLLEVHAERALVEPDLLATLAWMFRTGYKLKN